MTRRILIIIAAAVIVLPVGYLLIQRQIARTPTRQPNPTYLPVQRVSQQQIAVEPDLERQKRKQFEDTSRFFDGSESLGINGGLFGR